VIVVGPALPPPTLERRLLQAWYEEKFDQGFPLAYVQPGMTRVVQAGGRVVRGPGDRGVVVLVCQRFLRNAYADWLPPAWEPRRTRRPWEEVAAFFAGGVTAGPEDEQDDEPDPPDVTSDGDEA
jgi:Rad3-related DNA helicase